MRTRKTPLAAALIGILAAVIPNHAESRDRQFIRDAEVENTIRTYATPLFQAAGLSPQAIDVYLVKDNSLNAFVTPGLNMFIHTGLLIRAEDPLQVIGVLAHETGHLAAGHTATRGDSVRASTAMVIASYVLGLGAALATGQPGIARAAIVGGQDIALRELLSYTRSQESAADQFAVTLLNGIGQSPRGLLAFMRVLGGQEVLLSSSQDPYLRTHPITAERISFLEEQVRLSPYGDKPADPELVALHARMRAKLIGFLERPERVRQLYPESDDSLPARYARTIARYRAGDVESALAMLDALIAEHPDDPYFHELKGQINFESGRIAEAVDSYGTAARLLPDAPQIRLALAQAQLERDDPGLIAAALDNLSAVLQQEPANAFAWRLSAIAHGRRGETGLTALALAEAALARGKFGEAQEQARRAQKILAKNSPSWLRAQDIEELAKRQKAKQSKS